MAESITKADLIATIWKAYFPAGFNADSPVSKAFIVKMSKHNKAVLADLALVAVRVLAERK